MSTHIIHRIEHKIWRTGIFRTPSSEKLREAGIVGELLSTYWDYHRLLCGVDHDNPIEDKALPESPTKSVKWDDLNSKDSLSCGVIGVEKLVDWLCRDPEKNGKLSLNYMERLGFILTKYEVTDPKYLFISEIQCVFDKAEAKLISEESVLNLKEFLK